MQLLGKNTKIQDKKDQNTVNESVFPYYIPFISYFLVLELSPNESQHPFWMNIIELYTVVYLLIYLLIYFGVSP